MIGPFNPSVGDPEKTYEYIAHQVEREDNLYQTRLTTCAVVNLGLGAAVASQASVDINAKTYVIAVGCCVIGYLITRGIRFATNAGKLQSAYLRKCFGDLDGLYRGRFPCPYCHESVNNGSSVVAKFTAITIVFEIIWIGTFLFVTFVFFFPS